MFVFLTGVTWESKDRTRVLTPASPRQRTGQGAPVPPGEGNPRRGRVCRPRACPAPRGCESGPVRTHRPRHLPFQAKRLPPPPPPHRLRPPRLPAPRLCPTPPPPAPPPLWRKRNASCCARFYVLVECRGSASFENRLSSAQTLLSPRTRRDLGHHHSPPPPALTTAPCPPHRPLSRRGRDALRSRPCSPRRPRLTAEAELRRVGRIAQGLGHSSLHPSFSPNAPRRALSPGKRWKPVSASPPQ